MVGPRNVGRYELRDKLTTDEPHLFCVPIAHTSRPARENEMNGQDYYFVEKPQFEALKAVSLHSNVTQNHPQTILRGPLNIFLEKEFC